MTFAEALDQALREQGLSQTQAADRLKAAGLPMAPGRLGQYRSGKVEPDTHAAIAYLRALGYLAMRSPETWRLVPLDAAKEDERRNDD